jgi:hypothetical protein
MLKSIVSVGIGMVLLLPSQSIKSGTKEQNTLNYNQPYQDRWEDKPSVFKTVEDNNNLWKDVIKSRNKVAGYDDTEFANRINYCRYIGESVVLQKKEKFILENVLKYMLRCNHTQQQMITHYLEKDYKDDEKVLSQELISLYVYKEDEDVNEFMREKK